MNKHFKYLRYLLRHKWFVLLACWKQGLYWQGLVHDMSKFAGTEWRSYVEHFYGERRNEVQDDFDLAWLRHQHKNKHHWQHWVLLLDNGTHSTLPMPERFCIEMVCDWRGVSMALYGEDRTQSWYKRNRINMYLHYTTRNMVENMLYPAVEYNLDAYEKAHANPNAEIAWPVTVNYHNLSAIHRPAFKTVQKELTISPDVLSAGIYHQDLVPAEELDRAMQDKLDQLAVDTFNK